MTGDGKKMKNKFKIIASTILFTLTLIGCENELIIDTSSLNESIDNIKVVQSDEYIEPNEEMLDSVETITLVTEKGLDFSIQDNVLIYENKEYAIIEIAGGDRSGNRENNVAVNIGFGEREYWGLTNEYGQLVYVLANIIILQDDDTEPVNSNGRYYYDEAAVPGTEESHLDQGHVIADSLGGVANAYNITPQHYILNRYGDQAYMENAIRSANGCTNFLAIISYPSIDTQIPDFYTIQYDLMGNTIIDAFPNANPEKEDEEINIVIVEENVEIIPEDEIEQLQDLSAIDINGNGIVTIAEAKAAGYQMPITSEHWLYPYMIDKDGDGMVGE